MRKASGRRGIRHAATAVAIALLSGCATVVSDPSWSESSPASAPAPVTSAEPTKEGPGAYLIRAGDVLTIAVWKEADLAADVVVRPDGAFSFPLAGDIAAAGHSVTEVRLLLAQRLRKYLAEPVVTVAVKQPVGSRIYVVGKVNRPGDFALGGPIDVMQALGLAGGATPFASLNDIRIIRRDNGVEQAIRFRYHDIEEGRNLEQNILLRAGDTVVVP